MKKTLLVLLVLVLLSPLVLLPLMGLSLTDIGANARVGAGLGAKLACSGRYLGGLDAAQVVDDLASYTPLYRLVQIRYDDEEKSASANMPGMPPVVARFRPGLGCSLEIGDTRALDRVAVAPLPVIDGAWPRGGHVDTVEPKVQAQLDALLAADNAAGRNTRAMVVVRDGTIAAEAYADGFDAQTPLFGWSMGKSLTAILIGHLEYIGKADIAERQLFPAWQGDGRADISLENMLQMLSGLDFNERYAAGSDATRMLFESHSAAAVALASPLQYPPGERFAYSSGTTNLLTRLWVERMGGTEKAVNYLLGEILAPLGMTRTTFEPDASGVFVGSSYIYASARDWARLGLLMLNGGEVNGTRLLSEDWVRRAASPNGSANEPRYGYQFWLNAGGAKLRWPDLPADAYVMSGNRKQSVMVVPSHSAVLVRLGWSGGRYPMERHYAALLSALEAANE